MKASEDNEKTRVDAEKREGSNETFTLTEEDIQRLWAYIEREKKEHPNIFPTAPVDESTLIHAETDEELDMKLRNNEISPEQVSTQTLMRINWIRVNDEEFQEKLARVAEIEESEWLDEEIRRLEEENQKLEELLMQKKTEMKQ